jgi:hypothetical protein
MPEQVHTADTLTPIIQRYATTADVRRAGFVALLDTAANAKGLRRGDIIVSYSHQSWRRGRVAAVLGPKRVRFEYVTETAIREAADPRYRWDTPRVNGCTVPAGNVYVEAPAVEAEPVEPVGASESAELPAAPAYVSRQLAAIEAVDLHDAGALW